MAQAVNEHVREVYEGLFKLYKEGEREGLDESQQWRKCVEHLKEKFRYPVVFHRLVLDVMKHMLERAEIDESIEGFKNTIVTAKNFMSLLCANQFVHGKHQREFKELTGAYSKSENQKLLELSKKLQRSKSDSEFTEEWQEAKNESFEMFWQNSIRNINDKNRPVYSSIYQTMVSREKLNDLPLVLSERLDHHFSNVVGLNEGQRNLNQLLQRIATERFLQNRADIMERLESEFNFICEVLEEFFSLKIFDGLEFSVGKFGSVVNGFAMDDADLDITIMTNSYIQQKFILDNLYVFLTKRLNALDFNIENVSNASVPVVKVLHKPRRPGEVEVHLDILVNNICGVINSKYLRTYSDMNKSVKCLGILIKMWAKQAKLIAQNKLSSYSFMLMMIFYLIRKNIVPNILRPIRSSDYQETPITVKRSKQMADETFLVENYFDRRPQKEQFKRKFSLIEVFAGFISFYGENGQFWNGQPLICLDEQERRQVDNEMMMTIKDPFDKPHNPGRAKASEKPTYMEQFRKAAERLNSKRPEKIENMFR